MNARAQIQTIPVHRPSIGEEEIAAVASVLRSGWLTTGAECQRFEQELAAAVGARHALALNSCTAALHLALEAMGVPRGGRVLVPTLTFAATAEVVSYLGATPVLVDAEPQTLNIDPAAAEAILDGIAAGRPIPGPGLGATGSGPAQAIIPVHYAGQMVDVDAIAALAQRHALRVVEDAAHALPAAALGSDGRWRSVGTTADLTCFSFYANKTITTGEGGMLVTDDEGWAARARRMSLHGLSHDAWKRFTTAGSWYYEIEDPGFKYNLTDIAAALGRVQLRRAEALREARARVAEKYRRLLGGVEEIELPTVRPDRRHAFHLYVIRLHLDRLDLDRNAFVEALRQRGIGASVHYMPLHLHPYYRERFGYRPEHLPVATREWQRMLSLPIFPDLTEEEVERIAATVRDLARRHARRRAAG